jgi:proton-coupled amino acid transporter
MATPGATSFADVARAALGKYGMWITDFLIALMQFGFVIALLFFTISNLKSVADGIFPEPIDTIYVGIFVFIVTVPLCLVRRIEKFAFTYIFADALIFITAITILVFATIHIKEKNWQWGVGVPLINKSTWLTMIGSAIYSFEGVGVVLPILDVCEDQSKFPKVLFAVMVTNVFLYTIFGEYCLFVYGTELVGKPLITMNLPETPIIYALKAIFCVNVIISISLTSFPANTICEEYAYKNLKKGHLKTWIINF